MPRRSIILEGPDGSGKSTLAKFLSQELGRPLTHTGGPTAFDDMDPAATAVRRMKQIEAVEGGLFDRTFHISNPIYCLVDGRLDPITRGEYVRRLVEMKPIVVYCRTYSDDAMLQAISETPKPHKAPEYLEVVKRNHSKIVSLYDDFFRFLQPYLDLAFFAWDDPDPSNEKQLLLESIRSFEGEL